MASTLPAWIPRPTAPPHAIYVRRLYRRALREARNWYYGTEDYRRNSYAIRQLFEEHRHETDSKLIGALLTKAEFMLAKHCHPFPMIRT
jgi:hypothetical protein